MTTPAPHTGIRANRTGRSVRLRMRQSGCQEIIRSDEKMRFIINNENGRIRYVSGGLFVSNGVWTHPRFVLDDYELMVCIKGKFHLSVHGEKTEIKAGDALFLLPGEEHMIPVAESTVGGIHVIYGNYDFSGTELRLPGGVMLRRCLKAVWPTER